MKHYTVSADEFSSRVCVYPFLTAKGLKCLQEIWCIDLVLESMQRHLYDVQIQSVCLITLENMCKAGKLTLSEFDVINTFISEFQEISYHRFRIKKI